MDKTQLVVDVFLTITALLLLINVYFWVISPETQLIIPTIINGMATSISLLVGFTATAIAISLSRPIFKSSRHKQRISTTIGLSTIPIATLFLAYLELVRPPALSGFHLALKYAMMGLIIAIFVLLDFLFFITSRIETTEENQS